MGDAQVDAVAVSTLVGVVPATIRTWAHRSRIQAVGIDHRGRKLYRLADLVECLNAKLDAYHTG